MGKQLWGCKHCNFRYHSPALLNSVAHHCPPKSRNTKPAVLLEGPMPTVRKARAKPKVEEPAKPVGQVLKRRRRRV
jgi:hypothetical protein